MWHCHSGCACACVCACWLVVMNSRLPNRLMRFGVIARRGVSGLATWAPSWSLCSLLLLYEKSPQSLRAIPASLLWFQVRDDGRFAAVVESDAKDAHIFVLADEQPEDLLEDAHRLGRAPRQQGLNRSVSNFLLRLRPSAQRAPPHPHNRRAAPPRWPRVARQRRGVARDQA